MKKIIRVALMFSWDKLHVAVSISLALAGLVLFYKQQLQGVASRIETVYLILHSLGKWLLQDCPGLPYDPENWDCPRFGELHSYTGKLDSGPVSVLWNYGNPRLVTSFSTKQYRIWRCEFMAWVESNLFHSSIFPCLCRASLLSLQWGLHFEAQLWILEERKQTQLGIRRGMVWAL